MFVITTHFLSTYDHRSQQSIVPLTHFYLNRCFTDLVISMYYEEIVGMAERKKCVHNDVPGASCYAFSLLLPIYQNDHRGCQTLIGRVRGKCARFFCDTQEHTRAVVITRQINKNLAQNKVKCKSTAQYSQ